MESNMLQMQTHIESTWKLHHMQNKHAMIASTGSNNTRMHSPLRIVGPAGTALDQDISSTHS